MARRLLLASVPVVLIVGAAVFALWMLIGTGDDTVPPVAITAAGPHFESVEQMADASDVVVRGEVVAVQQGRAITDPDRPDAGILTQLVEVRVDETLRGEGRGAVVVEQEVTLLDGTPIVVNGLEPVSIGLQAIWFLAEGDGDEFPYAALVNEQGLIPLEDDQAAR